MHSIHKSRWDSSCDLEVKRLLRQQPKLSILKGLNLWKIILFLCIHVSHFVVLIEKGQIYQQFGVYFLVFLFFPDSWYWLCSRSEWVSFSQLLIMACNCQYQVSKLSNGNYQSRKKNDKAICWDGRIIDSTNLL